MSHHKICGPIVQRTWLSTYCDPWQTLQEQQQKENRKNNHFSSGNKSSPQSFSVPGIMFPPRRNIYLLIIHELKSPSVEIACLLGIQNEIQAACFLWLP